jgi:hypothetical protein
VASHIVLYLGCYRPSLAHPRLTPLSSHRAESRMHLTVKTYLGNAEKVYRASTQGSPGTETSLVRSCADCRFSGLPSQSCRCNLGERARYVLCVQRTARSSLGSGRKLIYSAQWRFRLALASGPCSTLGHLVPQMTTVRIWPSPL